MSTDPTASDDCRRPDCQHPRAFHASRHYGCVEHGCQCIRYQPATPLGPAAATDEPVDPAGDSDPGPVPGLEAMLEAMTSDPLFGSVASTGGNHDAWVEYVERPDCTSADRETLMHVLAHFGVAGAYPGGAFTRSLLHTIGRADHSNRARLGMAYPVHVGLVAALERRADLAPRFAAAAGLSR